jgi:alpha-ketoglutarate-dependent taurine dioxygenase
MHGNTMNKITEYSEVDFEQIKNNVKLYSESLISNGVIVFKKLFASEDQQKELVALFGDFCKWVPNSSSPVVSSLRYQENHAISIKLKEHGLQGDEEILIPWHLEHPYFNDQQIGAFWNNIIFKCSSEFGKTGFVDMREIYKIIPSKDWVHLLESSDWLFPWSGRVKPMIDKHRITGEKILRYDSMHFDTSENLVEKRIPTSLEIETFHKIFLWTREQLATNKDLQKWHAWDEGDMVIVDLQVSCHCVTTGFLPTEREFIGYWCYEKNTLDKERELESMALTRYITEKIGMKDPNESFRN